MDVNDSIQASLHMSASTLSVTWMKRNHLISLGFFFQLPKHGKLGLLDFQEKPGHIEQDVIVAQLNIYLGNVS